MVFILIHFILEKKNLLFYLIDCDICYFSHMHEKTSDKIQFIVIFKVCVVT